MGELVGVEPIFEYTPDAHTPLWPDVTHMHEVLGRTKVPWRDGFRRMIAARHPEIALAELIRRPEGSALMLLPGTPSDEVDGVLAAGRGDITTLFVSMATRHPEGTDAEYLRWHTLDHRPEQHRLSVRCGRRCGWCRRRPAGPPRAASDERFDADRPRDDVLLHRPERAWTGSSTLSNGARRRRTGSCRCCRPSSAASTRCRARRPRRGSRSVPTCCRGGRSEGVYLLLEAARDAAGRPGRRRRRRRRVVGGVAGRRRAGWRVRRRAR